MYINVYIKYLNHHFNFCETMCYCEKLLLIFQIVVIFISPIFYHCNKAYHKHLETCLKYNVCFSHIF